MRFTSRSSGPTVALERDPVILKIANSWLILNVGGGPTDDKPEVTLETPRDPNRTSAFLNIRVADIAAAYRDWSAKGAEFLTEPKVHTHEIRAYIRDPDGHLIEVGQSTVWMRVPGRSRAPAEDRFRRPRVRRRSLPCQRTRPQQRPAGRRHR